MVARLLYDAIDQAGGSWCTGSSCSMLLITKPTSATADFNWKSISDLLCSLYAVGQSCYTGRPHNQGRLIMVFAVKDETHGWRKICLKTSSGIIIEHKTIVNSLLDSLHEVGFYELSLDPINNLRIMSPLLGIRQIWCVTQLHHVLRTMSETKSLKTKVRPTSDRQSRVIFSLWIREEAVFWGISIILKDFGEKTSSWTRVSDHHPPGNSCVTFFDPTHNLTRPHYEAIKLACELPQEPGKCNFNCLNALEEMKATFGCCIGLVSAIRQPN